jgi:hypothetical protein
MTVIRTATSLLLFSITLSSALGQVNQTAPRYGYVFARDQRYAVVDLVAGRVVTSGNIAEVASVTRAYVSPFRQRLLVQGVNPADLNAPEPAEQLAILMLVRGADGPRLSFNRWLRGPTASSSPIWAKALSQNLLLVSWQDERPQTTLYDTTFKVLSTLDNFQVRPTTCLSSDGQTIYAVAHNPTREIKSVSLISSALRESSYASIGNATAYYKAPVASDGCVVAFIERMARATQGPSPATIYLHDVEKNTTLNKFNVEGDGRFALVLKRNLLLLDLTALVPNKLGDGTTVGLRRASAGSLLLYDTGAGKESARISVPPDGALAGVSSDGKSAYYLSPSLLTVIDLVNRRATAKIALPFPNGIFVASE